VAALALILLGVGVVVWLVAWLLILFTMDTGPDWFSGLMIFLWYVGGCGCLIVGTVLGVIALFQSALT
jgi:hypothetical protein